LPENPKAAFSFPITLNGRGRAVIFILAVRVRLELVDLPKEIWNLISRARIQLDPNVPPVELVARHDVGEACQIAVCYEGIGKKVCVALAINTGEAANFEPDSRLINGTE